MEDISQELALLTLGFKLLVTRIRQIAMTQILRELVKVSSESGYHLSDIFQGFSDYANQEKIDESPELQQTWDTVSALMKAAALAAETKGRELP